MEQGRRSLGICLATLSYFLTPLVKPCNYMYLATMFNPTKVYITNCERGLGKFATSEEFALLKNAKWDPSEILEKYADALATNNSPCPNQRIRAWLQDIQPKLARTTCSPKAQNKEKKTHIFTIFFFFHTFMAYMKWWFCCIWTSS